MSDTSICRRGQDGIGWLTLNRPESLNALSIEMTDLLIKHSAEFEKDPAVRCVVIRGAGTHFMAGGDIKGFHKSLTEDKASASRRLRDARGEGASDDLPDPPHEQAGAGLGAGRRRGLRPVADPELRPRDRRGRCLLHPGLPPHRPVGRRRRDLFPAAHRGRAARRWRSRLLGERFTAQEAKDHGILNWIVPKAKLAAETGKMARKLADGPTFALGVAKKLIRTSFDNSWDEHSHREAEGLAACAATEDHFEGLNAFLEKRKAAFKGR